MAMIFERLVIFKSVDPDGDNWLAVPPEEVPPFIWAEETIKRLADGYGVQDAGSDVWYIGKRLEDVSQDQQQQIARGVH